MQKLVKKYAEKGVLIPPKIISEIEEKKLDDKQADEYISEKLLGKEEKKEKTKKKKKESKKEEKQEEKNEEKREFEIVDLLPTENHRMSIHDMINSNNKRYEYLRGILQQKYGLNDLTTINKISVGEFSIIGVVKTVERKENVICMIEDITGMKKAVFEDQIKLLPGDVVGLKGTVRNDMIFVKDVMFPDIPLTRDIPTTDRDYIIRISVDEIKDYEDDIDLDIIIGENKEGVISIPNKETPKNEKYIGNPSMIKIKDFNMMSIPLIENFGNGIKYLENILKRRYYPTKHFLDPVVFEKIPDIIFSTGDKTEAKNYKGTTMISIKSEDSVIMNLKDREVKVL